MPYVDQKTRTRLDASKATLIREILTLPDNERVGAVNYCITEIACYSLRPTGGWRYHALNQLCGVFTAALQEVYRRLVGPYEDACIAKNGDIDPYKVHATREDAIDSAME